VSYLVNAPERFRAETISGFLRTHGHEITSVDGGVLRRRHGEHNKVAVVIGGGSGHYPAFAGFVGHGLADGAVMGDVFASPSATQIAEVARAVDTGAGVVLCYGNYTGDVLNFSLAEQRLSRAGIDCRTVRVTDDILSASPSESHRRRGVAGDLVVFKIAGASAERGDVLEAVASVAERANRRTRTMGLAFSGCTLPGMSEPLFSIPRGRMAVGMGIHGEPGLREVDRPPARELARMIVTTLAEEGEPLRGARVAVVVNGLGSVSMEELFVLFQDVAAELDETGAFLIAPAVGQFATSFDMAGVSVTLTWLDDELEHLWCAPCTSPGFSRADSAWVSSPDEEPTRRRVSPLTTLPTDDFAPTTGRADPLVWRMLDAARRSIDEHAVVLGQLDAVAGDGDHGIGMQRGLTAAAAAARGVISSREALQRAGDAWADTAGGTSGALWGIILGSLASHVTTDPLTLTDVAEGWASARDAVERAGGATRGDKTLVDALAPFADEIGSDPSRDLVSSWCTAVIAAQKGAEGTADLLARRGRARTHGESGRGHPDPGAVSFALVVDAMQSAWGEQ
jgi:dihydroxyacetone kinase